MARIKFFYDWDWKGAEKEFKTAIGLNPNYADSHFFYSAFLRSMKRDQEALIHVNKGLELDPISSFSQSFLVGHMLHMNQYDEAIRKLREIQKVDPNSAFVHRYLWIAHHQEQNYDKALEAAKHYFASIGKIEISDLFALRYAEVGYEGVMELVAEKLIELSKHNYVQPIWLARLYAYAGDRGNALKWLEISFKERDQLMVNLAVSKDWDLLRDEHTFNRLLDKMNLGKVVVD
jgi:tetratricopeptide (TPR) repeat protein